MSALIRSHEFARVSAVTLSLLIALAGPSAASGKRVPHPGHAGHSVALDERLAPASIVAINAMAATHERHAAPTRLASAPARDAMRDARALAPASAEPYGVSVVRAPEGPLWVKQRKLAADLAREAEEIAACRADAIHCYSVPALRFIAITESARRLAGRARLDEVNRVFNAAIVYTSDLVQFGVPDLWSAPLASLASGRGDCEDYAIAKYVALRDAGTAKDDLRILLVRDRVIGQYHAVLAARQDGRWLMLDNRWSALRDDEDMSRFVPLFAIDDRGVSQLAAPHASHLAARTDLTPASPARSAAAAGGESSLPLLM